MTRGFGNAMAQAGDGQVRSENRKLMQVISIRVDDATKAALTREARRKGYANAGAMLRARFAEDHHRHSIDPRERLILSGHLGWIGGRIVTLSSHLPTEHQHACREISKMIVTLQNKIRGD